MTTTPFPMTGPDLKLLPNGMPRPIDPATRKPLMAQAEANWHAHVSGMAARDAAEKSGDPQALGALVDAAASFTIAKAAVGDTPLLPLNLGIFKVLQMIGSAHVQENAAGAPIPFDMTDMARTALVFARPEWCYQCLKNPTRKEEMEEAVMAFAFQLDAPTVDALSAFIESEMAEFFGEDATAKKPDSPGLPPQPPASPESSEAAPGLSAAGSPP